MNAYLMIQDLAAHDYFALVDNAYSIFENKIVDKLMSRETWELTWSCFEEYVTISKSPVFQYSLFAMSFNWDWFIKHLGLFIDLADFSLTNSATEKERKIFSKLHQKPISEQLALVISKIPIVTLEQENIENVVELFLVRDLGAHNGWSVDNKYLDKSKNNKFKLGEEREISIGDLSLWVTSLSSVINSISLATSKHYFEAPNTLMDNYY
jgi:hypothetical protein